jgi:TM2 domain-containing membrane protein YozV
MPEKVWVLENPIVKSNRRDETATEMTESTGSGKNPAVAATLSLLIWGMGQFYNRELKWGFLFILLMANFYGIPALVIVYWNFLSPYLETFQITRSGALMGTEVFWMTGLIFWVSNVLHAYYGADKNRTKPFEGINHPVLVTFCSFLIPGWGQLLNGQPKKAFIFLIFAAAGLAAVMVPGSIFFIWPMLVTIDDRIAVEWMVVAAVVIFPIVQLMWLVGLYDAVKVGLDPVKKEPLRNRFEYAINRIRIKGLARGVLPQMKVFLMLASFLALSLALGYFYFPLNNYAQLLRSLEKATEDRGMVLTPYLMDHLLDTMAPNGSFYSEDRTKRSPHPSPAEKRSMTR